MYFTGLGTATPPQRYSQRDCWTVFRETPLFARLAPRNQALCERVLCGNSGIETRHLAIDSIEEGIQMAPDLLHRRFVRHAPALGAEAARRALDDAGVTAADIDGIVVSTCTGYLCPGLTSYLIERLGLSLNVVALDLVGQGCGAALPNWRTAAALLASGQCTRVLSICVEVSSAAFYIDDDPGVLISAGLFGDGAAAAVLAREPAPGKRRIEWMASQSLTDPGERDKLRFDHRNGLLRNILTLAVPRLAAEYAARVLADGLAASGLRQADIAQWIWHAGGRNVLMALQQFIGLEPADLQVSRDLLRRYGNLSSPFVYFVLQEALRLAKPAGWWWVSSFGAGFACHGALLRVAEAA